MNWSLAFIVPTNTPTGIARKLVFEDTDGNRATMLAGPWAKRTLVNKGTLDGAELVAPHALNVSLRQTEHGPVLVPTGVRMALVDPTVITVAGKLGADGKPLRNLSGGTIALTSFVLSAGDDEPALAGGAFAQVAADAATDEPALS